MKKIWYNINLNGSRVEQFETLEQAQDYLKKISSITQSIYEYDADCEEWNEISEDKTDLK